MPARRSPVTALATTCQEVRSSDRRTTVVARPDASVRTSRNRIESLNSVRTSPSPPPPPVWSPPSPSGPDIVGSWWGSREPNDAAVDAVIQVCERRRNGRAADRVQLLVDALDDDVRRDRAAVRPDGPNVHRRPATRRIPLPVRLELDVDRQVLRLMATSASAATYPAFVTWTPRTTKRGRSSVRAIAENDGEVPDARSRRPRLLTSHRIAALARGPAVTVVHRQLEALVEADGHVARRGSAIAADQERRAAPRTRRPRLGHGRLIDDRTPCCIGRADPDLVSVGCRRNRDGQPVLAVVPGLHVERPDRRPDRVPLVLRRDLLLDEVVVRAHLASDVLDPGHGHRDRALAERATGDVLEGRPAPAVRGVAAFMPGKSMASAVDGQGRAREGALWPSSRASDGKTMTVVARRISPSSGRAGVTWMDWPSQPDGSSVVNLASTVMRATPSASVVIVVPGTPVVLTFSSRDGTPVPS